MDKKSLLDLKKISPGCQKLNIVLKSKMNCKISETLFLCLKVFSKNAIFSHDFDGDKSATCGVWWSVL
jgi:hypothetical protein